MPEALPGKITEKLFAGEKLCESEYAELIRANSPELRSLLAEKASEKRKAVYGNSVFVRGLIEFTNCCKNNCLYCGIRASMRADRYRLSDEDILACCREGWSLGFRTFVLQGGEDPAFTPERIEKLVRAIKAGFPDCAVTLSVGEHPREVYALWKAAGADRYLLRHETADRAHYEKLHPAAMSFDNRMRCLDDLKMLGYQVGCGMMIGSPYQTPETLAKDLAFIRDFRPQMVGMGPFIPARGTPFEEEPAGTLEETLLLLSLTRLILPEVLLPATTALGTIHPQGRELGLLAGANVLMPNLSPVSVRKKYALYDNKICTGDEAAQCLGCLKARVRTTGCEIAQGRGDSKVK
ncbi:MAG: [Clostridia bacterium]|nr:[FeFe] hydrogenase H-cluster radical SAM maturase HydE [Clostridia bacterium]